MPEISRALMRGRHINLVNVSLSSRRPSIFKKYDVHDEMTPLRQMISPGQ